MVVNVILNFLPLSDFADSVMHLEINIQLDYYNFLVLNEWVLNDRILNLELFPQSKYKVDLQTDECLPHFSNCAGVAYLKSKIRMLQPSR